MREAGVTVMSPFVIVLLVGGAVGMSNSVYPEKFPPYGGEYGKEWLKEALADKPNEPSCDELKVMWRYYKRQSRADLTNEIPALGQVFWEYPVGGLAGFSPPNRFGGRGFLRPAAKGSRRFPGQLYGKIITRPRGKGRRPFEEVKFRMFGPTGMRGGEGPPAIVHFSPPETTKEPRAFEKVRQEMKPSAAGDGDEEERFGTVVLSPPAGSDGRIVNKPKELMTSFEKIRFGHAKELFEGGERGKRIHPAAIIPTLKMKGRGEEQPFPAAPGGGFFPLQGPSGVFPFAVRRQAPSANYDGKDDGEQQEPREEEETSPDQRTLSVASPPCSGVEGQSCSSNSQCSCVGFGAFRCYVGRCQILPVFFQGLNEGGSEESWAGEALPQESLGMWVENAEE